MAAPNSCCIRSSARACCARSYARSEKRAAEPVAEKGENVTLTVEGRWNPSCQVDLHFVRWTMAIVLVGMGAPLGMDAADWEKLAMWWWTSGRGTGPQAR